MFWLILGYFYLLYGSYYIGGITEFDRLHNPGYYRIPARRPYFSLGMRIGVVIAIIFWPIVYILRRYSQK